MVDSDNERQSFPRSFLGPQDPTPRRLGDTPRDLVVGNLQGQDRRRAIEKAGELVKKKHRFRLF